MRYLTRFAGYVAGLWLGLLLFAIANVALHNTVLPAWAQQFLWQYPFVGVQPINSIDFKLPPLTFQAQGGTPGTTNAVQNITIGNVAYSSLGTSTTYAATTDIYITSIYVPQDMTLTNINYLIGSVCGNAGVIGFIWNSAGTLIGNSTLSGTTPANTYENYFFPLPLTTPITIQGPGVYYIGIEGDSTSDTLRTIANVTFIGVVGKIQTGATFGTSPGNITVPTTFTQTHAPIVYLN